jgi:hypothetical protein
MLDVAHCLKLYLIQAHTTFRDLILFLKMTVFWVVAQCSLVEVYRCFSDRLDNGGSNHL